MPFTYVKDGDFPRKILVVSQGMLKRWQNAFLPLLLSLFTLWVFGSALSLAPVPWPDGSAFYLPALDLSKWPPHWRMHAQAAFVPTYDEANFNLMPALPAYLALFSRPWVALGCDATQVIRVLSWLPLLAWTGMLWVFLRRKTALSWQWAALVTTAALLDPISRWATLVVRTEIWVACAALGILFALERRERLVGKPHGDWLLPFCLAAGAYFHFEAVFLVPAAAWGLLPPLKTPRWGWVWLVRLTEVGTKTFLLLAPWVAYVLAHWDLFWEQMATQFARLEHGNHLVSSAYLFFQSLFLSFGNTSDLPKFFVIAKALFVALFLVAMGLTLLRHQRRATPPSRLEQSAFLMFSGMLYLWFTKGEVWFVSLVHWTFWPWIGMVLGTGVSSRLGLKLRSLSPALLVPFIALCVLGSWSQQINAHPGTRWDSYDAWVDCLVHTIEKELPDARTSRIRIFQPYVPDALVRLSQLRPQWDLTRALDFIVLHDKAVHFMRGSADVTLLTRVFDDRGGGSRGPYSGSLRESDRTLLSTPGSIPFAAESLRGGFKYSVCQEGPFWGAVAFHAR